MIVAFWAAVGKVALKVLQFLVGDKKGRKFLGYVIGIVLFIVLIPVIALYGLFGWMSGGEVAEIVGYDAVYQNLPTEIREQIDENELQLQTIETVFRENGLMSSDISKAKLILHHCRYCNLATGTDHSDKAVKLCRILHLIFNMFI